MPLPAPLVGLTVRAKLLAADSTPVVGAAITLTPTAPARSPAGDVLIAAASLPKTTASDGTVEWTNVLATDSPGLSNRVPYKVTTVDSSGQVLEEPYLVELLNSQAVGGILRLDDVARATPVPLVLSFLLAAAMGAIGGPAGPLDGSGKIPTAQIPAQGGVPDATTTSKGVIQLAGDLAGTATAPTVVGKVPDTRQVIAGAGLTGGGDLTTDRALAVAYGTTSGTAAQGNDTRITGAIQASTVDAKGDLLAGTADNTIARLAAGADGQLLLADSSQTPGLRWATRFGPAYDPAMDGLVAVAADPLLFRSGSPLGAAAWAVRLTIPAGRVVTGALACVSTAGTVGAGGVNGFAVYDDTGTLITNTTTDDTLWTATGKRSKPFPAPITAQNTDRYVYAALRVSGYTAAPNFDFIDGTPNGGRLDGLNQTHKRSIVLGGTTWAATLDPVTGTSSSGYMPLLALY